MSSSAPERELDALGYPHLSFFSKHLLHSGTSPLHVDPLLKQFLHTRVNFGASFVDGLAMYIFGKSR